MSAHTMSGDNPETLEAAETACLAALARAALDPRSPLRWPVLATSGADGAPSARLLVLRGFDRARPELEFWTDIRSPKVAELQANPVCSLVFFDRGRMTQLRVAGPARIETSGPDWERAFARAAAGRLEDYTSVLVPGAEHDGDCIRHDPARAAEHFARLVVAVETIDMLILSRSGHKRALLDFRPGARHGWRVP